MRIKTARTAVEARRFAGWLVVYSGTAGYVDRPPAYNRPPAYKKPRAQVFCDPNPV